MCIDIETKATVMCPLACISLLVWKIKKGPVCLQNISFRSPPPKKKFCYILTHHVGLPLPRVDYVVTTCLGHTEGRVGMGVGWSAACWSTLVSGSRIHHHSLTRCYSGNHLLLPASETVHSTEKKL